jgi:hypothetical protein
MSGATVVGLGLLLLSVIGCGGGKGLVTSTNNEAALPGVKGESQLATPAPDGVKLARGGSRGSIRVESSPVGAQVFLNGVNQGRVTPTTLKKLAPGTYTVRVVLGNAVAERNAVVTAGTKTTVFFSPLQNPFVAYATASRRILNASGGSVVFEVSASQTGVSSLAVVVTILRNSETTPFATVTLAPQGNNVYAGSFPFPVNRSPNSPTVYHITFSVNNGVTTPLVIPGGDITVQADADVPPPLPPL